MGDFFRKIHLWLGMVSGILIFLVCVSGAIYAFKEEIFKAVNSHKLTLSSELTQENRPTLPLDSLWGIAQNEIGRDYPVNYASCYRDPDKTWQFKAYQYNADRIGYRKWLEYDFIAYLNPYTGEVVDVMNHKWEFFQLVKMFHWSFLLNTKFGQPIVSFTVVAFLISLLTGLYMWWPFRKRKKGYTLNIQTKKGFNYDLHNVLGFYTLPVNLILSLTGMIWAFKWFMMLVYALANQSTVPPERIAAASDSITIPFNPQVYSQVYKNAKRDYSNAFVVNVYAPDTTATGTINTYVKVKEQVYYNAFRGQYDKYSGERLHEKGFDDLNRGEKIISMNYDIHTGAVLGLPGKILAFVAALVGASLPVTGFLIWWQKRKKFRKERNKLLLDLEK